MGQRADVILVAVGDDDGPDELFLVPQIAPVGDNVIHPQHVRLGEHDPCIHDQDIAAVFDAHHVLADFAQPSEGHNL